MLNIDAVDAVIGSSGKMKAPDIAERLFAGAEKIFEVTDVNLEPFEDMKITRGPRTRVYVKIEDGCESKCTYCAIPSARGNVRSKARESVIAEIEALSASGVPEIVLTGIETGSYGADFNNGYRLKDLIRELDERKSAKSIRLGSLAPELIGKDFVDTVKDLKILAPHFHLSIQSGSDNVLRGMKRRYSRAMALENIRRIREAIPNASFTTDVMVGFPGESDADFLDTVSFIEEVGFLDAHVFAYSRRKNTPAESYPNQIPESTKRERSEKLIEVVKNVRDRVLSSIVESKEPLSCIFEELRDDGWYGHSTTFAEVIVTAEENLHGVQKQVLPLSVKNGIIYGKLI